MKAGGEAVAGVCMSEGAWKLKPWVGGRRNGITFSLGLHGCPSHSMLICVCVLASYPVHMGHPHLAVVFWPPFASWLTEQSLLLSKSNS